MSNIRIDKLKKNLENFNAEIQSINAYHRKDAENYVGKLLNQREEEGRNKKADARGKIEKQILDDFADVRECISKLSFINPEILQTDTFKMFHGDSISLTSDEVKTFAEQAYAKKNFTLLREIQDYCDRHKLVINIPSAETMLKAYQTYFSRAMELVDRIEVGGIGITEQVKAFADENFGRELYSQLGDGNFLKAYSLPDNLGHAFDNVKVQKFGMDFVTDPMTMRFGGAK